MCLNIKNLKREHIISAIVIVILAVILVWWWKRGKKEHLEAVSMQEVVPSENAHSTERVVSEIPIEPQLFDAGSGSIMAGPEFEPSQLLSPWYKAYTGNLKNYYILDDGAGGSAGLQYNMCSKSCCGEQYPLPFKMPVDSAVCDKSQEFVPNNYMCNNAWQDTGCVCMTKPQAEFLGSRGGNA